MDIRIGIQNSAREIAFVSQEAPSAIQERVVAALQKDDSILNFVDERGSVYLVPTKSLAYIEISDVDGRRVGFVA